MEAAFIAIGLVNILGLLLQGLIDLPVGVYEMSLAVWFIVMGFHKQKLEKLKAN